MGAKAYRFIIILFLLFLFSTQAKATEEMTANVYFNRAGMKIISGVANVVTGWVELPKNIISWHQKRDNVLVNLSEGVFRGIVHTARRTGSGAVDLATFWLPTFPTPDPIFIWDDFSEESEYYGFRMGA